jgi:hypothetical protein
MREARADVRGLFLFCAAQLVMVCANSVVAGMRPLSAQESGARFLANRLDIVPVRANDESCVVVRVVMRAQTRRAIVIATRLQGRAIESIDLLPILGRERQVKMRRLFLCLEQNQ